MRSRTIASTLRSSTSGLPRRDGFTVARQARAAGIQTPMLMLTARDAVEDRVRGLDAGADDYLVKPFVEEELHARLRALLRRGPMPVRDRYVVGDLVVDSGGRTLEVGGKPVQARRDRVPGSRVSRGECRDRPVPGSDPGFRMGNVV